MRVMHLTTDLELGGAEHVIVDLMRCLRARGRGWGRPNSGRQSKQQKRNNKQHKGRSAHGHHVLVLTSEQYSTYPKGKQNDL